MFFRTTILLLLVTTAALAQSDAGVADAGAGDDAGAGADDAGAADAGAADAGEDPCDPRCDGDTLQFCDGEVPSTLDCSDLAGRCAELSAQWGDDCLLPAGAACDPGYAFGASRCDGAASLYCIDGACAVATGPQVQAPLAPSAGTNVDASSATSDPFACSSCGSTSAAGMFVFALALRRLRRARRS